MSFKTIRFVTLGLLLVAALVIISSGRGKEVPLEVWFKGMLTVCSAFALAYVLLVVFESRKLRVPKETALVAFGGWLATPMIVFGSDWISQTQSISPTLSSIMATAFLSVIVTRLLVGNLRKNL